VKWQKTDKKGERRFSSPSAILVDFISLFHTDSKKFYNNISDEISAAVFYSY
jgi:hypothetical protein